MPPSEQKKTDPPDDDTGYELVDDEDDFEFVPPPRRPRRMQRWVRVALAVMAAGFATVLVIAACLRPYDADGQPLSMGTHQQLGLQPCNMVALTGKPCPACGMTTSFALLVHGDVANSWRANWVGTLFCGTIAVLTPWAVWSAARGRLVGVRNGELFATILLCSLLALMMGRWVYIMVV